MIIDKVDVTIATKNNEDTIDRCIENIKKYIPYNEIIVVDGYSTDNTVQIAKRIGVKVYFENGPLGKVRYIQATLCTSEWIAVIDSDVFINENWWVEVSKYMANPNVGAINCWLEGSIKKVMPQYEYYTKFMTSLEVANPRSFPFSNTLIRRKFMLDSKSDLEHVHSGEDGITAKNVIKQGYKIVKIPKIAGVHYHKDPIGHAKMEYNRAGMNLVKVKGKLRGIITIFASPIPITYNWIRYSIHSHNLDLKLYKFLISLHIEKVKAIINEIKIKESQSKKKRL